MIGTVTESGSECFSGIGKRVSCPFSEIKEGFPEEKAFELTAIGIGNYESMVVSMKAVSTVMREKNPDCRELRSE